MTETISKMKFETKKFSPRFPEVECGLFSVHVKHRVGEQPRGTVTAFILPSGEYWIGIALTHPSDNHVKKEGRIKSIGRAYANYLDSSKPTGYIDFTQDGWSKKLVENLKFALYMKIAAKRLEQGIYDKGKNKRKGLK